jgi:hypothetical protein
LWQLFSLTCVILAPWQVYLGDCWQHLRNILIDSMAATGDALVKETLADDLAEFSKQERVEPDVSSVIRASFKQYHHGGEYCKGRGREFDVYHRKHHPSAFFLPFERAVGNRQDLKFDGCEPLYINRPICMEFQRGYIDCKKSENVLDRALYTTQRCNEFTAILRPNTLWKHLFSEPFRWLAGKGTKLKGWSIFKMSWVLELVEKAMQKLEAEPKLALDPTFDMFTEVAAECADFKAWREHERARTVTAADGKTKYSRVPEVMRRAQKPELGSGDDQATARTLDLIKAQAVRCLEKMHDQRLALADKLQSQGGRNSFGQNADGHRRTAGAHVTNDAVENKFATADYVMRVFRGISVLNASGMVQQRTAHDFDRAVLIVSDRRKRKASADEAPERQSAGFFWRVLDTPLRHALVEMVRHEVGVARTKAQQEKRAHDEEKLLRREEALLRALNSAVERYAAALELYDAWQTQGVRDGKQLDAALKGMSSNEKLAELRRQIEMRTVGCGWTDFAVKQSYNSDEKDETIAAWRNQLLDKIIPHEMALRRQEKLPAAAAPPQLGVRTIKALGTLDADAERLEASTLFNVERLLERAEAERARREAAGISDSVEVRQHPEPPVFDTRLVGKRLEVCWPYKENGQTIKIWASGTVRRIADGLTDKRSARAKKILPAGALLWAWDADPQFDEKAGEQWLVLLPSKWNKHVQYAWRFDPCELAPPTAAKPRPRGPRVDLSAEEEDYLDWGEHDCDEEPMDES